MRNRERCLLQLDTYPYPWVEAVYLGETERQYGPVAQVAYTVDGCGWGISVLDMPTPRLKAYPKPPKWVKRLTPLSKTTWDSLSISKQEIIREGVSAAVLERKGDLAITDGLGVEEPNNWKGEPQVMVATDAENLRNWDKPFRMVYPEMVLPTAQEIKMNTNATEKNTTAASCRKGVWIAGDEKSYDHPAAGCKSGSGG